MFVDFISCSFILCHTYLHWFWILICVRYWKLGPRSFPIEMWCWGHCLRDSDAKIFTSDIVIPRLLLAMILCWGCYRRCWGICPWCYDVEVIADKYCISISSLHILVWNMLFLWLTMLSLVSCGLWLNCDIVKTILIVYYALLCLAIFLCRL